MGGMLLLFLALSGGAVDVQGQKKNEPKKSKKK